MPVATPGVKGGAVRSFEAVAEASGNPKLADEQTATAGLPAMTAGFGRTVIPFPATTA